ncbi:MAG: SPOR domain-containing protein [Microvirga sp.]|nr:SPOR domain-containing protein [Microvirga sp.]
MSDTAKKRLAIDLEEIERQLRQTAPQTQPSSYAPPAGPGQAKNDPLAELARIVGQDDPFRSILSADRAGVQPRRIDPEMDDIFARAAPGHRRTTADYAADQYAPYEPGAPDPYAAQPYAGEQRHDQHASRDQEWREPQAPDWRESPDWPSEAQAPYPGSPNDVGYDDETYVDRDPRTHQPSEFDGYMDEANAAYPAQPPAAGSRRYAAPAYATPAYAAPHDGRDQLYADEAPYDQYADEAPYADDALYADERPMAHEPERRGRKRLVLVGAVLGLSVVGVAAAFVLSDDRGATGEPPLILAEDGPLKVEPQNPDGVQIPDQDRQIFERAGEEETLIADREEQPVDVAAVARQSPRVVLPAPAASQQNRADDPIAQALSGVIAPPDELQPSAAVSAAVAELGEPRRVRTVTVRPDGTIVRNESAAFMQAPSASGDQAARSDAAPLSYVPSAPWRAPAAPPAAQTTPTPEPASPLEIAAAPIPVAPPQTVPAPAPAAPLALTGAPAPAPAPQQTASVTAAPTAVGGGYAVQLGIRDTQARAEQAFAQFRDRYSSLLGGAAPIIMRAEVNGSTVYRVRVGPYALGDANGLCERIKGAGGDCFVARN